MLLLDANLLIYAFRRDLLQHVKAKRWLEAKLSEDEPLGVHSFSELAFLRITTNPRAFAHPSSLEEGLRFLDKLRSSAIVSELHSGSEQRRIFVRLAREHRLVANDLSDAFIAAAAIEAGAVLASTDYGFAGYRDLRWIDPLSATSG
jgi:toxin-antitoxin system PIN domain toxin